MQPHAPLHAAHCSTCLQPAEHVSCVVQLVRRWRLGSLSPPPNSALYCHNYSVRALATGPTDTLVSGDQSGEVAFWRI